MSTVYQPIPREYFEPENETREEIINYDFSQKFTSSDIQFWSNNPKRTTSALLPVPLEEGHFRYDNTTKTWKKLEQEQFLNEFVNYVMKNYVWSGTIFYVKDKRPSDPILYLTGVHYLKKSNILDW